MKVLKLIFFSIVLFSRLFAQQIDLSQLTNDFIMDNLDFYDKERDSSLFGFSMSGTGFSSNGLNITFSENKDLIDQKISKQQDTVKAIYRLAIAEGHYDFAAITLLYYIFEIRLPDGGHKVIADLILGGSIEPDYTDEEWKEKMINHWRYGSGKPNHIPTKQRLIANLKTYLESLGYDLE